MELSIGNIGAIIAYVIPGIIAAWGLSYFSPTVRRWLGAASNESPSFGGALLFVLVSLGAGLITDTVRAHTVDEIHHRTGVDQPEWSYAQLDKEKLDQFENIVENHFRFHQFYGNAFVALIFVYVARQISTKSWPRLPGWRELGLGGLLVILWIGSRSDLNACYRAIEELLGKPNQGGHVMEKTVGKKESTEAPKKENVGRSPVPQEPDAKGGNPLPQRQQGKPSPKDPKKPG